MRAGDLVRFKVHEFQEEWTIGLLIRLDPFMKVGEILVNDSIFYAPLRLIKKII